MPGGGSRGGAASKKQKRLNRIVHPLEPGRGVDRTYNILILTIVKLGDAIPIFFVVTNFNPTFAGSFWDVNWWPYHRQVDRLEAKAAKEEPLEENPLGILRGLERSPRPRSNKKLEQQGNVFFFSKISTKMEGRSFFLGRYVLFWFFLSWGIVRFHVSFGGASTCG